MSTILTPACAEFKSVKVKDLKPGDKKYWCACGLSKNQPWCDGSHKDTGITPLEFIVPELKPGESAETKVYSMCQCKHSKNKPFCDGTHSKLKPIVTDRVKECSEKGHVEKGAKKLCTNCGFVPDF